MQHSPQARRHLAVDIGNSGLKLTELDLTRRQLGATVRIMWQFCEHRPQSQPSVGPQIARRYQPDDVRWLSELERFLDGVPSTWTVSSVRSDALQVLRGSLETRTEQTLRVVKHTDIPIQVHVDHPERVGIDRLLAAWAAGSLTDERPLIVIEAGSAVTVDLLSSTRASGLPPDLSSIDSFEGGAIIPGVPMILRLLGQGADQLPEMEVGDSIDLPLLPGKNTESAMLCGATSALLGGVQHVVERYRENLGKLVPVILSGGDGLRIAPYIAPPLIVERHLVQRGLLMLASS